MADTAAGWVGLFSEALKVGAPMAAVTAVDLAVEEAVLPVEARAARAPAPLVRAPALAPEAGEQVARAKALILVAC